MALSEFDIIARYFNKPGLFPSADQESLIPLGIGDDCALLALPAESRLAISMDMLIEDIHFPSAADASLIAQRALAVNLSDLAAMGATPMAFTLGLSLPEVNENWLQAFSDGLSTAAQQYLCPLVGGDMSKGGLTICIQVHGYVHRGNAIKRSGAAPGDKVYVSGCLGEAGLALKMFSNELSNISREQAFILNRAFYQPQPRLALGQAGAGLFSAAIDISDGLMADLAHVALQSGVAIELDVDRLPVSQTVQDLVGAESALAYALVAGDEYELAFTVAEEHAEKVDQLAEQLSVPLTCVGKVKSGAGVSCLDVAGSPVEISKQGYQHF